MELCNKSYCHRLKSCPFGACFFTCAGPLHLELHHPPRKLDPNFSYLHNKTSCAWHGSCTCALPNRFVFLGSMVQWAAVVNPVRDNVTTNNMHNMFLICIIKAKRNKLLLLQWLLNALRLLGHLDPGLQKAWILLALKLLVLHNHCSKSTMSLLYYTSSRWSYWSSIPDCYCKLQRHDPRPVPTHISVHADTVPISKQIQREIWAFFWALMNGGEPWEEWYLVRAVCNDTKYREYTCNGHG